MLEINGGGHIDGPASFLALLIQGIAETPLRSEETGFNVSFHHLERITTNLQGEIILRLPSYQQNVSQ